ncbi:MAG: prolyl oligopeptidase family serine peptidase [Theionarchaea archaeon]|nr:prolyl oligopeptidase family serine peptidase [Theionarchaea archaeon]
MKQAYQHMVQDYYVDRVRVLSSERDEIIRSIETEDQVIDYQRKVKRAVSRAFGKRPKRTPLNPQITGILDRPGYKIEKIIFESRPDCLVTANLYIPRNVKAPAPGVISPCGHSGNGKALPLYQEYCQRLAASGFVVLIYDPYNQGERDQYHALDDREIVGGCCNAHNMMGKQLELLGEFFGMWRAWDGIRALDYLVSRPEVDGSRVGLTGNSGGGTMSEWLWAVEDRFAMVAPGCFVTTFLANLENELPQDCEQYPPGILGAGLEMIDLMILRAPKPALLLGQAYDYFDRRGLIRAYQDMRQFYSILGRPGNVKLFIGTHGHGYHRENQEAMVKFFARIAGIRKVVEIETEDAGEENLWATPGGNVIAHGGEPIFERIARDAAEISSGRTPIGTDRLPRLIAKVLAVSAKRKAPHHRSLRLEGSSEMKFGRYAVETEGGVQVVLRKLMGDPEKVAYLEAEERISLYLPHFSIEADFDEYASEKSWVPAPVYTLDPRGMGESVPGGDIDDFSQPYGYDYMYHGFGLLLCESYMGRRVHDVLSTMDLLVDRGAEIIDLYGRGQGALLAIFAGILHPKCGRVTLKNGPNSFLEWAKVPLVLWPASNFPREVLKHFDIPDCHRFLGERLRLIEPWEPDMKSAPK